jgi:LAGLIDADG DNA endonuclease family
MDDGLNSHGALILCTDSYTLEEVQLLVSALKNKFNIKSRAVTYKDRLNKYRISIPPSEMPKIRLLVSKYIHPSLMYKIYKK